MQTGRARLLTTPARGMARIRGFHAFNLRCCGYTAAVRAGQLGLKTVVIEMNKPGGVCLNVGCIPSKALLRQAEHFLSIEHLKDMGVRGDASLLDYSKVLDKFREAVKKLSRGVRFLLKKNQVDYIEGEAVFAGRNGLTVKDEAVRAGNIIAAPGSGPRTIPCFEFDEKTILSSTGAIMLKKSRIHYHSRRGSSRAGVRSYPFGLWNQGDSSGNASADTAAGRR